MKTIALFNQAGGVGKTTVTHNLGYHLALRGHRVLIVDMDPQSSLTIFMGLDTTELTETICDSLIEEPTNDDANIQLVIYPKQIYNMDLAPSSIGLAYAEIYLANALHKEYRLKEALESVKGKYDYVLVDCPPSLGILSINCLVAADYILVPIETQFKALMGADMLLDTWKKIKRRLNKDLKIVGFLPTMYGSGRTMDQQTLETIKTQLSSIAPVFAPLPSATALPESSQNRKPFIEYIKKKTENNQVVINVFEELATSMEKL